MNILKGYNRNSLYLCLICLIFGFFNLEAQLALSNSVQKEGTIPQSDLNLVNYSVSEAYNLGGVKNSHSKTTPEYFQQSVKIELVVRAEYIFNHIPPGKLKRKHLFLCLIKDDFWGRPQKSGFCSFFRSINHIKDFTSHIFRPEGEEINNIEWSISTPDPEYNCSIVRIEANNASKRNSGIFENMDPAGGKVFSNIDQNTKEGNYRYTVIFEINGQVYSIDPTVKVH